MKKNANLRRRPARATKLRLKINDLYVLHAESDEDAADDKKHLALQETGRFTGVFQGSLRLTDADGNGGDIDEEREQDPAEYIKTGDSQRRKANTTKLQN